MSRDGSMNVIEKHSKAVCEHNQLAANHLLRLLYLSQFGSQRYKTAIQKAIRSVCIYPFPIETEKDALSLDGVGKFLSREIMKSLTAPSLVSSSQPIPSTTNSEEPCYKPEHGRGPWALMIALRFLKGRGSKEEILKCIKNEHIEVVPGSLDGAKWSTCIRTLRKKGILTENSPPDLYELTTIGLERVAILKFTPFEQNSVPNQLSETSLGSSSSSSSAATSTTAAVPHFTLDLTAPNDHSNDDELEIEFSFSQPEFESHPPLTLRERIVASIPTRDQSNSQISKRKFHEEISHTTSSSASSSSTTNIVEPITRFILDDDDDDNNDDDAGNKEANDREGNTNNHNNNSNNNVDVVIPDILVEPISLSQPTTDRDKRRCLTGRRIQSTQTQTFSLVRSSAVVQIREDSHRQPQQTSSDPDPQPEPEEWEVVVLIDRREKDYSFFQLYFTQKGIKNEVCQLALGDYLWVAKRKSSRWESLLENESSNGYESDRSDSSVGSTQSVNRRNGSNRGKSKSIKEKLQELHNSILVLDCIVERKTVNDLASSIVDGRYEEQKFRLKSCGIPHCVYLVEGASLNPQGVQSRGKSTTTDQNRNGGMINTNAIITALAATQAMRVHTDVCRPKDIPPEFEEDQNDASSTESFFHVVNTRGLDHTASHLLCLHRLVEKRFFSTPSPSIQNFQTFHQFQESSSRKQRLETMSDLLISQLRQLPGCSTSAAKALSDRFGGTVSNLHSSLSSVEFVAAVDTVSEVKKINKSGSQSRVGPALSQSLVTFLTRKISSNSPPNTTTPPTTNTGK